MAVFRQKARKRAKKLDLPITLTLGQWNSTISYFHAKCAYCQKNPFESLDHFIPLFLGGGTTGDNCVPACLSCNSKKGDSHPDCVTNMPRLDLQRVKIYLRQFRTKRSWKPYISVKARIDKLISEVFQIVDSKLALEIVKRQQTSIADLLSRFELTRTQIILITSIANRLMILEFELNREIIALIFQAYRESCVAEIGEWVPLKNLRRYLRPLLPGTKALSSNNWPVDVYHDFFEVSHPSAMLVLVRPIDVIEFHDQYIQKVLLDAYQACLFLEHLSFPTWITLTQMQQEIFEIDSNYSAVLYGKSDTYSLIQHYPELFDWTTDAYGRFLIMKHF